MVPVLWVNAQRKPLIIHVWLEQGHDLNVNFGQCGGRADGEFESLDTLMTYLVPGAQGSVSACV